MPLPPSPPQPAKASILVIDDEKRIRDACAMVLGDSGFAMAVAEDGSKGLQMVQERHYDIILLDLMMPAMSGFEVLSAVRSKHPDTVVIVITGYATLEHSIEAMKKGAFDFIPKPFTPDQLRTVVDKALRYTEALQDISESKSRLKVMVNRLTDGVMTTDPDKRIVQINPAFLHMIGYQGEQVVGRQLEDIVTNDSLQESVEEALHMGPETYSEVTRELNLHGRDYSSRCAPFRGRNGNTIGTITVLHDISAAKQMDQMKSDFVSMVSHEVRSPMNSLLMQLKVIMDGLAGEVTPKQLEILERASEKIINLNSLVTELLDLSRIESGLIAHEKEEVDLVALLFEQQQFHLPFAREKEIRVELSCQEKLPPIFANRQNMEEVFSNLIVNAIKYSPEKATVTIHALKENEYLKITVSDTGFGLEKEELAKIFTRFYRVKDANTREIQGTGLGLSLVKSIVDSHHGKITVASSPGKGSVFSVLLPLAKS